MAEHFICPVCGYPGLTEAPYGASGTNSSYEICASCGFEYGVTDDDGGYTFMSWRRRWVHLGMPWDSVGIEDPPEGWDPVKQLQNLDRPEPESPA